MTGILIGPSIPTEPLVRPLAMPLLILLIQVGSQLLISGVMNIRNCAAPFRISSIAKGEKMHPMVYTIVEDIVAVDGGAGKGYRERLRARYDASWRFRLLIAQLNWFWAAGALIDGIGTMVALWTIPSEQVAYGVGECQMPGYWPCIMRAELLTSRFIAVIPSLGKPSYLRNYMDSRDSPLDTEEFAKRKAVLGRG